MDPFELAAYHTNPGEERLRLWKIEKRTEIELKVKEMRRDRNAQLGQKIRDVLRQRPDDHHAVVKLCRVAEEEEAALESILNEGVQAEAERLSELYMHAALSHQGEPNPSEQIRERLSGIPDSTPPYCSPVLMETLLWEGIEYMPNTHRRKLELDFPARVEALLDFHCIAFHADVSVLKELYDEDVLDNKEKRREILNRHRTKMEGVMAEFAEDMKQSWAGERDRMRSKPVHSPPSGFPLSQGDIDWMMSASVPTKRRAHMTDPPTILPAAEQNPKAALALPTRGILKKVPAGSSDVRSTNPAWFNWDSETAVESTTFDEEGEYPGSFFRDDLIVGNDEPEYLETGTRYLGPEIVVASSSHRDRQYTSASQSQQPIYEIYRPNTGRNDIEEATPRAAKNVARLTQRFEERMDTGKGKGIAKAKARTN
ncbi:hypothetical protein DFH09DRAFT_1140102 [Mycena vulgaris]|nr:hypothetical protein DFH09DRAFT_1140102 [Mycena vulgaris]